ncbi:MAG: hypothetical protein ACWGNK_06810 [Desulfobacterales bacterium]
MKSESKLVPVLREAVTVIQVVLFKRLKLNLSNEYPGKDSAFINRLCGAVVNELFGTPNTDPAFADFNAENHDRIQAQLSTVASAADDLLIPLTDSLRIQFLCDSLEGIDSSPVLVRAERLGILLVDRKVPLPRTFMNLVRRVGAAHNLLQPSAFADEGEAASARQAPPETI